MNLFILRYIVYRQFKMYSIHYKRVCELRSVLPHPFIITRCYIRIRNPGRRRVYENFRGKVPRFTPLSQTVRVYNVCCYCCVKFTHDYRYFCSRFLSLKEWGSRDSSRQSKRGIQIHVKLFRDPCNNKSYLCTGL